MVDLKKYQIILADPAWSYRDKALAGKRGAECKYPVLTNNELKQLRVDKLADKDCALFIWVTMPKLNEVFELIKEWGFEYKTCAFTWIKRTQKSGVLAWGMGRYTRANAELCLLATKGKLKRIDAGVHSVIDTKIGRHSAKPNEVRERIVKLFWDLPRIELFARESVNGWDAIGNDIDGCDIRDILK